MDKPMYIREKSMANIGKHHVFSGIVSSLETGPNPGLHRRRCCCAALSAAEPSRRDVGDATSVPLSTVEIWGPSGCQETWQEDNHLLMGLNGNIYIIEYVYI